MGFNGLLQDKFFFVSWEALVHVEYSFQIS